MDPASLSFAVVGMFLTCCKGYQILSDSHKAPSDAQDAARRIRIEGAVLATWGDHFEIRQELREEQRSERLRVHIMQSPSIPHDVQDLLDGRMQSRSPNFKELEEEDEKMKKDLGYFKLKMALLEKCRWSLQGKERIHSLINDLRRYNDDLLRLCSIEALRQINRGHPTFALPLTKNFMEWHLMADIAEETAKDKASPMAE
ncbi:MAG: hypothetical protein Q9163_004845, partial [Psora crenata]